MQEIQFIAKSKTVILIAHRLSTIKSADRIYMLKNGEIASVGNFQHMLKAEPDFFSKHL